MNFNLNFVMKLNFVMGLKFAVNFLLFTLIVYNMHSLRGIQNTYLAYWKIFCLQL